MKSKIYILLFFVFLAVLQSCKKQDTVVQPQPIASNTNAQVAVDWMEAYRQVVKSEGKNPPQASRIYAYAGIAVYESVVPGMQGYQSLQGQLSGLDKLPKPAMFGQLDYAAIVNEAMYQTAVKLFGTIKPENTVVIEDLHTKYFKADVKRVFAPVLQNSVDFGKMVASAIMDRANSDGFAATRSMIYVVPSRNTNPSFWAPTNAALIPLEPYWGKIKCFTMDSSSECELKSSIPFSTVAGSPFYNQVKEVVDIKQNLTTEQKNIANWWADNAGATSTPPGHWVGIENQLVQKLNLDLAKAAEMYALVNITLGDAFISCWDAKYKFNLLRPQTYIRDYIPGQNTWTSFIGTPPFPEYPSGHSVSSGAAAEMLTKLFGSVAFTDETNTNMGMAARSFTSFYQAADEAAVSRLYGGIHYREANENGVKQGKELAKLVLKKIKLKL